MKSLVLRNIDIELLQAQKGQLDAVELEFHARGLTGDLVTGAINFLDRAINADTEQKTLEDHELGDMVHVLEEVVEHHRFNDFTTEDEDKALEATIAFLKGDKVPRE